MNLKYDNFIFDLYGTLVDIHTDENKPEFWKKIAGFYSCYGADYTPEQLQQKYFDFVMERCAERRPERPLRSVCVMRLA